MRFLTRLFQRVLIFIISVCTSWLIVMQLFARLDQRLPLFFALVLTYIISAYILLPQIIRFSVMVLRRNRIPRMTHAADGLPADPVNIILAGTAQDISSAFVAAGWRTAERLTLRSGWRMMVRFVLNTPYPEAPFSALYLFGRKQDLEFQEPIGNGPRKRNHIRLWAASLDPQADISDVAFWIKKHPVDPSVSHVWVGAATKDTGFGFAKLTYQISHRVDKEVDEERDHVSASLKKAGWLHDERYIDAGELVAGKYVSNGKILWARLHPGEI